MAGLLVNAFLLEVIEENERRGQNRIVQRALRDVSNPLELHEKQFKTYFRLSKECATYLINSLTPPMKDSERVTAVPKYLRIFAALHFYGNGGYQFGVGQTQILSMSQPTISRAVTEVTDLIVTHLLEEWIKFPTDALSKNEVKRGFLQKFGIPGIIGAIDCTHIAIIAPPEEDPHFPARVYFNRKGYTSINTQIITDSSLKILNINARYPGGTHDSAIWATSSINRHLQQNYLDGDDTSYLIGDSGYPLQPWLLTPINNAAPAREQLYNARHIWARNTVERLNGVLKGRFRCLLRHRTLNYDPVKSGNIIYSCAVLHNICQRFNDFPPNDEQDEIEDVEVFVNNFEILDGQQIQPVRNWHAEGERIRNNLIQRMHN